MAMRSKTVMPTTFKGIGDNYGQLHSQFARTGAVFPYYRFGYYKKGNQENGYIILLFLEFVRRSRSGVGAGVRVGISRPESESELKSLEIRQLHSPGYGEPEAKFYWM